MRNDDTLFDAEVSLSKVKLNTGIHIRAVVRDISERKKLDKKLWLMERWVDQSVNLFFGFGKIPIFSMSTRQFVICWAILWKNLAP